MSVLNVESDAKRVLSVLRAGNIAIVPHDVAYGIWGHSVGSIEKMYETKGRSLTKTSGNIGNYQIFKELHIVDQKARDVVTALINDFGLAFTAVGPFRSDHPFYQHVPRRSLELSTKDGTLALLLNAGPLHDELARLSLEQGFPIFGSSANKSLTGSKFRLTDIEPEVRKIASIEIDYGLCRYHNPKGISSTIIDLVTWKVHRYGVCFDQIRDILNKYFRIELGPSPYQAAATAT